MLDNIFGFAFRQPIYKTLVQMRVLQVTFISIAVWLSVDAWFYMKDYALEHPDATWLVAAMPAFIGANIGGLWAALAESRKKHPYEGKEDV